MRMPETINEAMFAPCGINCTACYAHVKARSRRKVPCPGCRNPDPEGKPASCLKCRIKNCADGKGLLYCFTCGEFPCKWIRDIDRRYRKGYAISLVENSEIARETGIAAFLRQDMERWRCTACGGVVNEHGKECSECGRVQQEG